MVILAIVSNSAVAGVTINASSVAVQPQIDRDESGFKSCGVRGVIVTSSKHYLDAYDFSLMVSTGTRYGTLNAGNLRFSTQNSLKRKSSSDVFTYLPAKYWLAQASERKATEPIKIIQANGYLVEHANLKDTRRRITALINGKRMRFFVHYKNQPEDIVVNFSASMPAAERSQLLECLAGV